MQTHTQGKEISVAFESQEQSGYVKNMFLFHTIDQIIILIQTEVTINCHIKSVQKLT